MKKLLFITLGFFLVAWSAHASHGVGGSMTYTYLGDSLTYKIYQVKLVIFQDAAHGQPQAIAEDNPAFIAVYNANAGAGYPLVRADSVFYSSADTAVNGPSSVCAAPYPDVLILRKTFLIHYALPANSSGYIVEYQRCCSNGSIINMRDPSDNGFTYSCTIPAAPLSNSSAVFNNVPPFVVRLNTPLSYNFTATDPDGDSLSYDFAAAVYGATNTNIKPFPPGPPPFDTALYMPGFNSQFPVSGSPAVRPGATTGVITGIPNRLGRYLVGIACKEWRAGLLINTTAMYFDLVTTDCVTAVPDLTETATKVYPNPVSDNLHLEAPDNITSIAIINPLGQIVYNMHCNDKNVQVPVAGLASGVYIIKINNKVNGRFTKE